MPHQPRILVPAVPTARNGDDVAMVPVKAPPGQRRPPGAAIVLAPVYGGRDVPLGRQAGACDRWRAECDDTGGRVAVPRHQVGDQEAVAAPQAVGGDGQGGRVRSSARNVSNHSQAAS